MSSKKRGLGKEYPQMGKQQNWRETLPNIFDHMRGEAGFSERYKEDLKPSTSQEEFMKQMLGEFKPDPLTVDEAIEILEQIGDIDAVKQLTRWIEFVRYNSKDAAHMADQHIGVKE